MYSNDYHRMVASTDLGIYNWKAHSTGWLLKQLRTSYRYGYNYWEDFHAYEYWHGEYILRVRDELSKRPHLNTKGRRKKRIS